MERKIPINSKQIKLKTSFIPKDIKIKLKPKKIKIMMKPKKIKIMLKPVAKKKISLKPVNTWNIFQKVNRQILKGMQPSTRSSIYHQLKMYITKNDTIHNLTMFMEITDHKILNGLDHIFDVSLQKYRPYKQQYIDLVTGSIEQTDQGHVVMLSNLFPKSTYGLNFTTLDNTFAQFVNSNDNKLIFHAAIKSGLAFQLINKLIDLSLMQKGYSITVDDKTYYYINKQTADKLKNTLKLGKITIQHAAESDGRIYTSIRNETAKLVAILKPAAHKPGYALSASFFKWYHKLPIDLSAFQIYTEAPIEYKDNCLFHALRLSNVSDTDINQLKIMFPQMDIRTTNLSQIADHIKKQITIHKYRDTGRTNQIYNFKYGSKYVENGNIDIGFQSDHYFIIKDVEITLYALKNYEEAMLKYPYKWNQMLSASRNFGPKWINSLQLIHHMVLNESKYLIPIKLNDLLFTQYNTIKNLKYELDTVIEDHTSRYPPRPPDYMKTKSCRLGFFDFETDVSGLKHIPLMVHLDLESTSLNDCAAMYDHFSWDIVRNPTNFDDNGFDWGDFTDRFAQHIVNYMQLNETNLNLYAHNLKYDINFLIKSFSKYKISSNEIGTTLYQYTIEITKFVKGFKMPDIYILKIIDSYKMLPMKLDQMPRAIIYDNGITNDESFEKELIPYKLVTYDTMKNGLSVDSVKNYKPWVGSDKYLNFLKNCRKLNFMINKQLIDIYGYCHYYCQRDVEILRKSYCKFRLLIHKQCEIDITQCLTLSTLAHKYLTYNGSYDDVQLLTGISNDYIRKFNRGGKVCLANNSKPFEVNDDISDLDARSLYPSAMVKLMKDLGGILNGYPKPIIGIPKFNEYSGYFATFRIKSVGIRRRFPLLSFKKADGSIEWKDDESVIGCEIDLDKIGHEDAINFQNVELEFLRGYYYDQSRNPKQGTLINMLYEKRLDCKKSKNTALELVYKNILNSAYGKLYEKIYDTKTEFFNSVEKFHNKIHNKQNFMILSEKLWEPDNNYGSHKPIYKCTYYKDVRKDINIGRAPHISSEILSMSKRIMNQVMCLAEDNSIEIYYQDTDSMHIKQSDIPKLCKLFKDIYGYDMIGINLGQFGSDFKDPDGLLIDSTLIAKKSIFLGKKCYCDELEGSFKSDPSKKGITYHFRMKGIPQDTVIHYCKKSKITIFELYKKLMSGEPVEFDLTNDNTRACFDFNQDPYCVYNKENFIRSVSFDVGSINSND